MAKATNLDSDIVYSTPKEERDNKKEFKNKKRNFEKKREKESGEEEREETKPAVDLDSDGFEIISEKKQGDKKKFYKKREYDENGNGERKKYYKKDNDEERPDTAIKKTAGPEFIKAKPVQINNLNKVTVLENVNFHYTKRFYFKRNFFYFNIINKLFKF